MDFAARSGETLVFVHAITAKIAVQGASALLLGHGH
jgi:hypothetical protein